MSIIASAKLFDGMYEGSPLPRANMCGRSFTALSGYGSE
jgi:hypothetical protein